MYTQSQKTRYANNEYPDMPSIDFHPTSFRLTEDNMDNIEWDVVNNICSKHGFKCTIVKSTFGGDHDIDVFINKVIDCVEYEWFENLRKERKYGLLAKLNEGFEDELHSLHDCINDLDINTNLYFRWGWIGNCGIFGSHDVRRNTYCEGRSLESYNDFVRACDPMIHDTAKKFKKGVYVSVRTYLGKMAKDK